MTWKPVLESDLAERARAMARSVAAALDVADFDPRATGLAAGPAGLALFHAYLAEAEGDAAGAARARAALVAALAPREGEDDPGGSASFFSGFPGLTWAAAHLDGLLQGAAAPLLADADRAVAGALAEPSWSGTSLHADGLVGLGVYLLERPRGGVADQALANLVAHLERSAVPDAGGAAWLRPAASFPESVRPPADVFDLGVPRGTAGVVGFLAAALARGITPERTAALLRRGTAWLLQQRSPGGFGDYVVPGSPPPSASPRLGWCYGDLGVSAMLLGAARALGDSALEAVAVALALGSTDRAEGAARIEDAGFCHGAGGAGHLYARLYAATGEPNLRTASRRWFERALAFQTPGEGSGGFLACYPLTWADDEETFHRHADPGLLMGASGVGLTLVSAAWPVTPAWDRCFLLPAS
jgi:hypothetical protein